LALLCIPKGNGKHAAESLDAVNAPLLEGMENYFGIGMVSSPAVPAQTFEFHPDISVVVDFPVEDHP